ncbi:MAG: hypothetical protein NT006_03945 [Candidatus Aminicenantes bacterium]|nr:hypothetical protein [Candidatus Aminicenantes bacterium]
MARTANSSPPIRPMTSDSRSLFLRMAATPCRSRSPTAWPQVIVFLEALGDLHLLETEGEEAPAVVEAGEVVGQGQAFELLVGHLELAPGEFELPIRRFPIGDVDEDAVEVVDRPVGPLDAAAIVANPESPAVDAPELELLERRGLRRQLLEEPGAVLASDVEILDVAVEEGLGPLVAQHPGQDGVGLDDHAVEGRPVDADGELFDERLVAVFADPEGGRGRRVRRRPLRSFALSLGHARMNLTKTPRIVKTPYAFRHIGDTLGGKV